MSAEGNLNHRAMLRDDKPRPVAYVSPLATMVAELRATPVKKRYRNNMKALRRQVQRDFTPPHAARWSGRQWRRYRKAVQRGEA